MEKSEFVDEDVGFVASVDEVVDEVVDDMNDRAVLVSEVDWKEEVCDNERGDIRIAVCPIEAVLIVASGGGGGGSSNGFETDSSFFSCFWQ